MRRLAMALPSASGQFGYAFQAKSRIQVNYLFENYPRAKTNEDILALLPHNLKQKNLKLAPPSIP